MAFNLKFVAEDKKIVKIKNSCLVMFLHENQIDKFDSQKEYNFSLPENFRKKLKKEKTKSVKLYNHQSPELVYVYKINIKDFNNDFFRDSLSLLINDLCEDEIEKLQIIIPEYKEFSASFKSEIYFLRSFVEGILFGNYKFNKYQSEKTPASKITVIFYGNKPLIEEAIKLSKVLMEGVYFARDLANEPGNVLYPIELSRRIKKELQKENIKISIFDEKWLTSNGMGGILAVGKGSDNPPRLIVLKYKSRKKVLGKYAIVGKGVTFDSGGISIKPSAGMGEMKADMSGAAAVAGVMLSIAKSNLPFEVIGVIPAVENMPSGKSMRPGDIVKTYSGKTIEVDNTDAEGRVILSDALNFISKEKPDAIIDLATLTGACVVALGEYTAGIFTKSDYLAEEIYKAGLETFERVWRLPLWDEYSKLIESDVADVKNTGGRFGGSISAAKFLENFVDETIPWIHIDIAGPALPNKINSYSQKYMTGFGVRLLFELFLNKILGK